MCWDLSRKHADLNLAPAPSCGVLDTHSHPEHCSRVGSRPSCGQLMESSHRVLSSRTLKAESVLDWLHEVFCWQTSSATDDLAARTNSDSNLCTRRRLQGKSSCSDVPRQSAKLSLRVLTTLTGFPFLSCYYATGLTHSVRVTYAFWASSYPQAKAVSVSHPKGIWHLGRSETVGEVKRKHLWTRGVAPSHSTTEQPVRAAGHVISHQQEWPV